SITIVRTTSTSLRPYNNEFISNTYTTTTLIYTLSLHDALPIYLKGPRAFRNKQEGIAQRSPRTGATMPARTCRSLCVSESVAREDRKSTRLNSSHQIISYAVFCLKKKKKKNASTTLNT